MERVLIVMLAGGISLVNLPLHAQSSPVPESESSLATTSPNSAFSAIPPLPRGRTTILGGEIRDVDPVLDKFTLRVYGLKPLKVFYDERTQVFQDGKKITLRDLQPAEHASVQTTLDGASVFAISIHILSKITPGQVQAEVLSYDPESGELSLSAAGDREPFRLVVSKNTQFTREGQGTFTSGQSGPADLQQGALVSVQFDSDLRGHGVASRIAVLAIPGSAFLFSGNITAIDVHSGRLVVTDPRDSRTYDLTFDPGSLPATQNLRPGQHVRVSAEYDGTRYTVRELTLQ